ncbi:AraC family transcriptional regulator [Prevotella sp.]|uniref:AraC family transcriptional regulator n=1 Tax=Prevotella sp. TaxID=59823 RepID=UPI002648408D|nr:GyrI-like domain-containing protein [Prevotella sp.]MDN5553615.1 GyrI-like domain-containing protein [Prevotella sp.]
MDTRTETMHPCSIAYIRRTGAYGIECKTVMEQLKSWAKQTNNLKDDSIILGIALDNPEVTIPESCRYDACLVVSNDFHTDDNDILTRELCGGKYCVFTVDHTTESIQQAWSTMFTDISTLGYTLDFSKPIIERYAMKMIRKHLCEICVPIR